MTLVQLFTAIANAIRAKKGTSGTIIASNFPTEIASITTGIDTSDANAVANDIVTGKTAYVNGNKLTGTYTGIIPTGTKSITQNGTVDVSQYASANVNVLTPTPTLQSKSVTITENGTTTISADSGYDGLNEVEVTTNVSGGGSQAVLPNGIRFQGSQCQYMDWLENVDISQIITMNSFFHNCQSLRGVPLIDTSNVTEMNSMFYGCTALRSVPLFDTKDVTTMYRMFYNCNSTYFTTIPQFDTSSLENASQMFYNCYYITDIPVFDFSKVTAMQNIFKECTSLTSQSLNNILETLISATSYTGTKTLAFLGMDSVKANACTQQSNWSSAQSEGWTTGY